MAESQKKIRTVKPKKSMQDQFDDILEVANDTFEDFDTPIISLIKQEPKQEIIVSAPGFKQDFAEDYAKSRQTLNLMLSKGTQAIDAILELAAEGESARTYEVVGQLIKITSDVAKDLLGLQKTVIDIQKLQLLSDDKNGLAPANTNNGMVVNGDVVFTGTTEDALRKIKQLGANQVKE
jgi:hypothetical protein